MQNHCQQRRKLCRNWWEKVSFLAGTQLHKIRKLYKRKRFWYWSVSKSEADCGCSGSNPYASPVAMEIPPSIELLWLRIPKKARQNKSMHKGVGISVCEYTTDSSARECYETNWTSRRSDSPSTQQAVVWIVWQWTLQHQSDGEWRWLSSHVIVLDVGAGDRAVSGCVCPYAVMQWGVCVFGGGLEVSYVFWGSGEMGPGVLVPSILCTGIWNWGVRTVGN